MTKLERRIRYVRENGHEIMLKGDEGWPEKLVLVVDIVSGFGITNIPALETTSMFTVQGDDANARVARAVGQWQRIQRTKAGRPYLIYELGPSLEHRFEHVAWAGSIRRVDDPIWNTLMPPNGWGCKCRVRQLSQAEADAAGGETAGPELEWIETTDPATGETVEHPRGVDPEWAYNPGAAERPVSGA